MMSLTPATTTNVRTYCLKKIKANTPQEALSGIKFFTDLENHAYVAKLLCADRFLVLCGDLTIDGVKGFYLVSDERYKALSKDEKPRHKLSTMFEAQFPNNNWKTLTEYFREFNNLKKQDERCLTYDAKTWLTLCGDKTQKQLRLPNSVHTTREELTAPVATVTPVAVGVTPEEEEETPEALTPTQANDLVPDSSDDEEEAVPTPVEENDDDSSVVQNDDDSDSDSDSSDEEPNEVPEGAVITEVVQNGQVHSRIKDICEDLCGDPDRIHQFITHLISSHESVTLPKVERSYLASANDDFIVRTADQIRPRRR